MTGEPRSETRSGTRSERGAGSASDLASETERLFALALAHAPAERAAVLDRECGDPALRREVEALLRADAMADRFLEPLPVFAPGSRLGPYRLSRKIGEGETSSVYLATRDDGEYEQRVAIKLLRPGIDSRQVLQRFQQERQILASLIHPNIARLLDGGSTPAGQPYLVMEYVDGQQLDVHCERGGLSIARRLELFGVACQAVHFAHRNLVVHRDLKPGNILVDAAGAPKLVDFGIAKLLDPDWIGVRSERTATVARLMTPHYASPEQVTGKPISTASDVYSLGVILYRLITGRRPYELASTSLHEIERVVCETVPPPPSQAVGGSRRARLPRDLDNIVLMAMRKEPERRYASAQELADDLRRCLDRHPVRARPDTVGYRMSSFVRRHTAAVAAAAAIAAVLIGGALVTIRQWQRAVAAQGRAETERRTAQHTLAFLVELFKAPDSPEGVGELRASDVLARGVARLRDEPDQPGDSRAALQHTLGVVYRNLGDHRRAAALLEDALAARSNAPDRELELADSLYQLGGIDADNGHPDRAKALLTRALEIRTRLLGPDDLSVADVLEELADNAGYKVPVQDAQADMRRALEIRRHHPGDPARLSSSMAKLAQLYAVTARHAEAEALVREAIAIRGGARGGRCRPNDSDFFDNLSVLRYRQGYYADAEHYVNEAIECKQRVLGPDHVDVVDLVAYRIVFWREQGRYAEAEDLARQSLPRRRALHGGHSPAVDNALHILAYVLYERGKLAEAAQLGTEAFDLRERAYGRTHHAVAGSLALLGEIALARGDARAAEASYREALAIWHTLGDDDRPDFASAMRGLAETLLAQGQLDAARSTAEQALAWQRRMLRPWHPALATTLAVLGRIVEVRAPAAAEPLLREAVEIRRASLGPDHPYTARAESQLGECLALLQRTGEALPLLRHGAEILRAILGEDHPETGLAWKRLAGAEARIAPDHGPGAT